MSCLLRALVVIVILLLNAIGAEQKAKIEELPGTRPVHVYAETISAASSIALRVSSSLKRVVIRSFAFSTLKRGY